ncbi:hypothetical protein IID26_01355 [Patescibacteria group bacterium]|nr:hypothetical protein [Patescibacteria group bacterium]
MNIFSTYRNFLSLGGILATFVVLVMFLMPFVGLAQDIPGLDTTIVPSCEHPDTPGCNFCDLVQLSQNIINFLVGFAIFVAVLLFVYAGFLYLSAGANEENVKRAHKLFGSVFIGFILVLASWLIIDTIMKAFVGDNPSFGPWNNLGCGG